MPGAKWHQCSVCSHEARIAIDEGLLNPRVSLNSLEKQYVITRKTLAKHRAKCLAKNLNQSVQIHRAVGAVLEAQRTHSELETLYKSVRADWEAARERGEWSLAIKAVRELTRMYELQARLVLEAREGRAADVGTHPLFQEFLAMLVTELRDHPEVVARVKALVRRKLDS